ncbi:MAG TPA: prepilin-type N-terminal cleavage/methylation domain-containing protein [Candidatus Acidoferrales bacterium]|jgi:prepilin-type N-terminal cleavage/methylation domain-containing protein|nr:prepilin-type N-terminal cleavage/methylation domain-containing protein [Candidatus Acidoferrales bacterium]
MELNRPRRSRRRGSAGLTLIELLVAITVLAMIGGALGGAFAIGIRALGPGGSQERLAGSHDLLAFEQQIGADVARADCLAAPGQVSIPTGGCKASVQNGPSTCGAKYVLCLAWYLPGSSTCHTVIYSLKPDRTVLRTDISASGGAPSGRSVQVTTNPVLVTAAWTPVTTTSATYKWTNLVNVTVTQRGAPGAPVLNPATATFKLVPLSVDPLSPILPGGSQTC